MLEPPRSSPSAASPRSAFIACSPTPRSTSVKQRERLTKTLINAVGEARRWPLHQFLPCDSTTARVPSERSEEHTSELQSLMRPPFPSPVPSSPHPVRDHHVVGRPELALAEVGAAAQFAIGGKPALGLHRLQPDAAIDQREAARAVDEDLDQRRRRSQALAAPPVPALRLDHGQGAQRAAADGDFTGLLCGRSEEHTSELQSLMRIS